MGGQNGTDKNYEATYSVTDSNGIASGGPGFDYVLVGFPLDNMGFKLGDTIEFSVEYESNSRIYHHQSVDQLLGDGTYKEGSTIRYVIGSNTYTDLGVSLTMKN